MRAFVDRTLAALAGLALRGFFRDIEIVGRERIPADVPLLVVANHFNAIVDAALVVHSLGRLPRFVAKAALWDRVWRRPFLWLAGLVPVYRRQDTDDLSANHSAFSTCQELLVRDKAVALFPEGAVSRTPALAPVRTGAARIALGARSEGARGLRILPIGLTYEDRVALRSRALVHIGEPIDLDAEIDRFVEPGASDDEDNHDAVRGLTAEIAERMAAVTPEAADTREAAVLARAADVALRPHGRVPPRTVPLADRERVARELAHADRADRERLLDLLARYELDLSLLGLRDAYLVGRYRAGRLFRLVLLTALALALVAPFALVGAVVNAVPYWGVHWAGRVIRDPLLKGTARLLSGVALFPPTWLVIAWLAPWQGWLARLGIIVAAPVLGLIAVRALEAVVAVARSWRGWITLIERSDDLAQVRADRARVVALVHELAPTALGARTRDAPPAPARESGGSGDASGP
ncbi:MAG: 1-acyl-sn-glycerol-3-phosphate acyltransferase [Egibacteraceae bacterium]